MGSANELLTSLGLQTRLFFWWRSLGGKVPRSLPGGVILRWGLMHMLVARVVHRDRSPNNDGENRASVMRLVVPPGSVRMCAGDGSGV